MNPTCKETHETRPLALSLSLARSEFSLFGLLAQTALHLILPLAPGQPAAHQNTAHHLHSAALILLAVCVYGLNVFFLFNV